MLQQGMIDALSVKCNLIGIPLSHKSTTSNGESLQSKTINCVSESQRLTLVSHGERSSEPSSTGLTFARASVMVVNAMNNVRM